MANMTLSEELEWRGFVNQHTFDDIKAIDGEPFTFYFGVDPSAASMQIGNLASAMMVRHFIDHGHKAVLLVGGATGLIGDPDGKSEERTLKSTEEITKNKAIIAEQYKEIFAGKPFKVVDNYDWFKDLNYLDFLRDVGKHVPMRQMLQREFVQSRLNEKGISYAEFSYVLIQAYDFLYLNRELGVTLQVCGSDQWGNSIAGVELIRRITGKEANVWSVPLIINKATGKKFGKSEEGTVWLNPELTSPTQFYQFWINCDDEGVKDYLKVFTLLGKPQIEEIMAKHAENPRERHAQVRLAQEVTKLVHGDEEMKAAEAVTAYMTGKKPIGEASDKELKLVQRELPHVTVKAGEDALDVLVRSGLSDSKTEARRLLGDNAISVNNEKFGAPTLEAAAFQNGRLLLRKGKAFKDSALILLAE